MSKKRVSSTVLATGNVAETVTTIHGETVNASELGHIRPYLHRFAIRVGELVRDPDNARKHGKRDLTTTSNSLKRFGQTLPLLFNPETKTIIVGNGRHECAQQVLEWQWVAACPFVGTREQAKAYGLADNRTAELSEWDQEKLAEIVDSLGDIDPIVAGLEDFSLDDIGLGGDDLAEIEELFADKAKKKSSAVEAKTSESAAGKTFDIVIKCVSESQQVRWGDALADGDVKALAKLCVGVDFRMQS